VEMKEIMLLLTSLKDKRNAGNKNIFSNVDIPKEATVLKTRDNCNSDFWTYKEAAKKAIEEELEN
jgi:hypothetical protein